MWTRRIYAYIWRACAWINEALWAYRARAGPFNWKFSLKMHKRRLHFWLLPRGRNSHWLRDVLFCNSTTRYRSTYKSEINGGKSQVTNLCKIFTFGHCVLLLVLLIQKDELFYYKSSFFTSSLTLKKSFRHIFSEQTRPSSFKIKQNSNCFIIDWIGCKKKPFMF